MTKETVLTRKDMKEPDKFQQAAGQAAGWLASRKRQVLVAGAAALAIVLLLAILVAVRQSRSHAAGEALSLLLESAGGTVSAVPLPGDPGPFFPTEEARQRAVIAAADSLLADHAGSDAATLALLAKGDAHLKLREWDPAKAAYERFLSGTDEAQSLRFGAIEGLALVAEGQGNLDAAAEAYARLGKEAPSFADRADLERARVLAQAGKTDEARTILSAFGEAHKESLLTAQAAERLTRLGGK
jgi:tetratricopeptide (TPR) repeat protein